MFLYSYALLAKSREGITASLSDIDIFPLAKIKSAGMVVLAIILGRKLHVITIAQPQKFVILLGENRRDVFKWNSHGWEHVTFAHGPIFGIRLDEAGVNVGFFMLAQASRPVPMAQNEL